MNFTSLVFFIFLPIALLAYWLTPNRFRWIALLVASYFFYSFLNYWLIGLILFTTLVSYLGALGISKYPGKKKLFLALTLIACLGTLFVFKYLDFTLTSIGGIFSLCGLNLSIQPLNLVLPVGISFYTFQTISYVVDVYREKIAPEKHLGYYALFVSFFPQLVAGPIEQAGKLLPELRKEHRFTSKYFSEGLRYIFSGFLKKVVIADFLVVYVNQVYGNLANMGGWEILLATFLFGIVIYCDFSGYSEIALGIAKWMGIDLSKNFDRPYLSTSLKEFWNRWHITLNRFFTEYVYIPMGGSKKGRFRKYLNIFIVFLLSGLWHGASLHFVVWGVVSGLFLILEDLISPLWEKLKINATLKKGISIALTYLIINMCWIFFRAQSMGDVGLIFARLFFGGAGSTFFTGIHIALTVLVIIALPLAYYLPAFDKNSEHRYAYIGLYFVLALIISVSYIHNLSTSGESSFIYFSF